MKEKFSSRLFVCLFFIYTSNILGKMSFSAATVALVGEEVLTKTQAGLISSVFWLLYAVGQLFGGFLTKKISPYMLITVAVLSSVFANLSLVFAKGFWLMLLVWGVSGALQFGLWPATLELVSTEIVSKQRASVISKLAVCYCLGSIIGYALTTVILAILPWNHVFLWCGIVNVVAFFVTVYAQRKLSPILRIEEKNKEVVSVKKERLTKEIIWKSALPFFSLLMLMGNFVETSIKSWMPTIMMETYGATPSYTSFLTVLLLITNIFGVVIGYYIYGKTDHDELKTIRIMYIAIVPMLFLMLKFKMLNIYLVTVLLSGITLLQYSSKQFIAMNYPGRFHAWGFTAAIGGIVNGFAAFGNVLATYGSGYIADAFGWDVLVRVWNALIILMVLITIFSAPLWKRFRRRDY